MNKYLRNEKGSMLALALIYLIVFSIMGFGLINLSAIDAIEVVGVDRRAQAFWIAEAGIARTIFNLKMDIANVGNNWGDGDINGISCGPNSASFYALPYSNTNLGNGSYSVELKNVAGHKADIWVRSTGTVGSVSRTIQVYLGGENRNIWNNAIFADCSQTGRVVNGNVDIRGSVHILGNCLAPTDLALEFSGTGGVGNNYLGADSVLLNVMPDCPQVEIGGVLVDSLSAKVRVMNGLVSLSGTGTLGDPNINGNAYKEKLDGVYVNDGYTGNQGVANVFSDNGAINPYSMDDHIPFPSLDDGYLGYPSYYDYLRDNALVITDPAALAKLASITPNLVDPASASFDYNSAKGRISFDGLGHLTIDGIVYIGDERMGGTPGDLVINKSSDVDTVTYSGKAAVLVTGNVQVDADFVTVGAKSYPQNIIGVMTPNNIQFGPNSQIDVAGVFYAETKIKSMKQTEVAGSFVAGEFDMGTNVPAIYQVWEIIDHLPVGLIGASPHWVIDSSHWEEI